MVFYNGKQKYFIEGGTKNNNPILNTRLMHVEEFTYNKTSWDVRT